MKMNLPRFIKRSRLFYFAVSWLILENIVISLLFLAFYESPKSGNLDDSKLIKTLQQQFDSQSKQIDKISKDFSDFKKDYQKLNQQLENQLAFKEGLKFVLAAEGGVSNDKADTGGLTNMGITHDEYAEYRISKKMPPQSVRNISLTEAVDIYKHKYWIDSGCGATPRRIAISCFDWDVNSGRGMSTLQQVLGGISVDGILGPETSNELASWLSKPTGEDKLLHNYFQIREDDYRRWGVGSQRIFLAGWLRREKSLKDYLNVS